jgi:hypothetical protein
VPAANESAAISIQVMDFNSLVLVNPVGPASIALSRARLELQFCESFAA